MTPPPAKDGSGAEFWFGRSITPLSSMDDDIGREFLADLGERAGDNHLDRLSALLTEKDTCADHLAAISTLSPFLRGYILRRPEVLESLFDVPIAQRLVDINRKIQAIGIDPEATESTIMKELRLAKAEAHFLIALDDLSGDLPPGITVQRMSELANAAIRSAIDFLLADSGRSGKLAIADLINPGESSGLIVLAMGKLGAGELNYSSDIDLVIFYDPEALAITAETDHEEFFPRMARRLVRILQDRTGDGYVFRTDLRLRPDPGSTPLAFPVGAALNYYESRGQNWERAAFIKAQPVAGDIKAGQRFLRELTPFIWRKYMDYAAIAEVHSIKRQIYAHKGHGTVAVKGHNVKLGRGGIREIEFFVQTQQLIAGGRFPDLRGRETVPLIGKLKELGWIDDVAAASMIECYWYLRDVENRLQMISDEQTHNLPEDEAGLEIIARLMRSNDAEMFAKEFRQVLETVERHYAALFEAQPKLVRTETSLVFSTEEENPDTLALLSELGYQRPNDIYRIIRNWHSGRYRATQSAVAREHLTAIIPKLLETFADTKRADDGIIRFDAFLSGLPAGVQLFSLLSTNPSLMDLLATIMAAAPRLADIITKRPHVFDGLLDPTMLSELPDRAYLSERLDAMLADAIVYEDILDRLRIFAAEQKFLIGIRLLTGAIEAQRAGKAFSDLASLTVGKALAAVRDEFAKRHGRVPGESVAILGMGKLGSRELTAGSDIDMILLYDHDPDTLESDGEKPLAPSHYFARLTQRLIAAVSAPTAEGVLYEIDMRLRPSGNQGPVATHFDAFSKYQREEAWTWEHMALTRARPVAGDQNLCERAATEIAAVMRLPRDQGKIFKDAAEMRETIADGKPPTSRWDLKLIPGGQIDIEFIAQVAILTGNAGTRKTGKRTAVVIDALQESFADLQIRSDLLDAWSLYATFTQITRLCLDGRFSEADTPPGLIDLLLRNIGEPDMAVLAARIDEVSKTVRKHFNVLLAGMPSE